MKEIRYQIQNHREADIQAILFNKLYQHGIEAHLEYMINGVRVDMVVVKGWNIICAIEVKDINRPALEKLVRTKQYQKYLSLGIPFFYCFGYTEIENILEQILSIYKSD